MKIKERKNVEEKFKSYLLNALNCATYNNNLYKIIEENIKLSDSNSFFSDYRSHFNNLFSTNKDFVNLIIENKIVDHSYYYNDLSNLVSHYFKNGEIDKIVFFAELFYIYKELNFLEFAISNNLTNLYKRKHHRLKYFLSNILIMRIFYRKKEKTLKNIINKHPELNKVYHKINIVNNIDSF